MVEMYWLEVQLVTTMYPLSVLELEQMTALMKASEKAREKARASVDLLELL